MADIELVIKISEEDYKGLQKKDKFNDMFLNYYEKLIANGTPLPKGHGRLIDANNITFSQFFDAGDYAQAMRGIYNARTIVEADNRK
jgi:hypothetical protein